MSKAQGTPGEHGDPRLGRHRQDVSVEQPLHWPGCSAVRRTAFWPRRSRARRRARSSAASSCGLAEAAVEPKKLAELAQPRWAGDRTVPAASVSCGEMVRHLHRLRVSTLDSFFVEMAQSFGLELGLPPGWAIADEIADQSIRTEAIRTVLQDESTQRRGPLDAPADQGRSLALGKRADRLAGEGFVRCLHGGTARGVEVAAPPEAA